MKPYSKAKLYFLLTFIEVFFSSSLVHAQEAQMLIEESWDYMRGDSSQIKLIMTVHRPEWERSFKIHSWSKGRKNSVFFIVDPPKDKGNGTLKKRREMWIYNPKVKRIIKIPPSMMSQSWMGSDFSNNDLSKSDSVLDDYTHEIVNIETEGKHKVYVIQATPKPNAPVVWGMQILKIRDDHILIEQSFYDEDQKLVKEMLLEKIETLGNRLYPKVWTMRKAGAKDKYTQLIYESAQFNLPMDDNLFSHAFLKSRRRH